jgi:type 1 glutamine amidotransferase
MMGLALAGRRRRRTVSPLMLLAVFVCLLGGLGCGGGSSNPPVTPIDSGADKPAQAMDTGGPSPEVSGNDTGKDSPQQDTPSNVNDSSTPDVPSNSDVAPGVEAGGDMALPKLNVLAIGQLTENGQAEIHAPFVMAAKPWLAQLATETGMTITHVESPNAITDAMLANYNLILQLNFKPFGWNATAQAAFEKYITEGKGGWIGLHHAGLYGPAVSSMTWPWFFNFFGMINWKAYIATFAQATVRVEDAAHPLFKGVPATFVVTTEEWYTWDKNPRPNVKVLANVDESTYMPNSTIKMGGDHPVIWSNDTVKAKNVYIFMGHHPNLFQNTAYTTMLRNAIFWAGTPK